MESKMEEKRKKMQMFISKSKQKASMKTDQNKKEQSPINMYKES